MRRLSTSLPSCGSTWWAGKSTLIANFLVIKRALGSIVKNGDEYDIEKEQCLPGVSTIIWQIEKMNNDDLIIILIMRRNCLIMMIIIMID